MLGFVTFRRDLMHMSTETLVKGLDETTDADVTYVVLLEKDPEWGFPRRLGVYEIAESKLSGAAYRAAIIPLKEIGIRLARGTFGPRASTEYEAHLLAVVALRRMGERLRLEVQVRKEHPGRQAAS